MDNVKQQTERVGALFDKSFPTDSIRRISLSIFKELTSGEPVAVEQIATKTEVPLSETRTFLDEAPIEWDDQRRIVGFGISLTPQAHGYEVNGHKLGAWCAGDALLFPVLTGLPAHITTQCHVTKQPITLDVTPEKVDSVEPATAVVIWVAPENGDVKWADVREAVCSNTHFFASEDIAQRELDKYPGGVIVPVAVQFEAARRVALRVWKGMLNQ